MSNNQITIETVQTKDPLTKVNIRPKYVIVKGGEQVAYANYSPSSASNSSSTFDVKPGSPDLIVSRKIMLEMPLTIDFTGTVTGSSYLLVTGFDAFRSRPLSKIINTITAQINNSSVSLAMNDTSHAFERYNQGHDLDEREYSIGPTMRDSTQQYANVVNTVKNPLAGYGDSTYLEPRGAFPITIVSNTSTTAQITCTLREFLYLSPFSWGQLDTAGFTSIHNFKIILNYTNPLSNIWSHSNAGGSTLSTITVTLGVPTMRFKQITPVQSQPRPSFVVYPYHNIAQYPKTGSSLAANTSVTMQTNTIQLTTIPSKILIYVARQKSARTFLLTDSFCAIESISINYLNRNGLLSNASQGDLYQIAQNNGCNQSWAEWSGATMNIMSGESTETFGLAGGPLMLEMSRDIGLPENLAPGMPSFGNFQLTITFKNPDQDNAIVPEVMIVSIEAGTLNIMGASSTLVISPLSKDDVIRSAFSPTVDYNKIIDAYGGNFLTGFKKFASQGVKSLGEKLKEAMILAKKAAPHVKKGFIEAKPYIKTGLDVAKQVGPYLPMLLALGLGVESESQLFRELQGKYGSGGVIVGGKKMSKRILRAKY